MLSILAPLTDEKTGALAWSATRVRFEKLDKWVRLPKFENSVADLPEDEEQHVLQITRDDT